MKMAVIRGARENVISFYEKFQRIQVKYIAGSFKPLKYKPKKKNLQFRNSLYYKPFGIDPGNMISQYGNLSWIFLKDLEENIKDCSLINISDTYYFPHLQVIKLAEKYKLPLITVIWTTIPHHITSWFPPYSLITKSVIKKTNLFILRSKKALNFTDSIGIPRNKTIVIHKGIDLNKFKPRKESGNRVDTVKILFTGNLSSAKGLDDLLYCYQLLRKAYPQTKLIIAGDGPLLNQIRELNNKKVLDYKGFVAYKNLPKLYREADIYCAPSKESGFLGLKVWEEYFSYALMEAQATGLPVVSTKSGGISEEVEKNNLFITPGDRGELYKALEKLIIDKKKRQILGRVNRARAEKMFDEKIQARKTEEAILSIMNL